MVPNLINDESEGNSGETYVCVWGSTLPLIAAHAPAFGGNAHKIIVPSIRFRDGINIVKKRFFETFKTLGVKRSVSDRAVEKAYKAQQDFTQQIHNEGRKAIRTIKEAGEKAIVLVGRPYNVYDRAINLSVAVKLSSIYGINVIPMDFIDYAGMDIQHINDNMYWNYGRKILETAVKLHRNRNLILST